MKLFNSTARLRKPGVVERRRSAAGSRGPRTATGVIVVLSALFAGAIVWAARTDLQEIARAEGEIVPTGRLVYIEHFDGGIVEEVLVRAGSVVSAGQAIARLSSPDLFREEAELRQDAALLTERHDDLAALLGEGGRQIGVGSHIAARRDHHLTQIAMLNDRAVSRTDALAIAGDALTLAEKRMALAEEDYARSRHLHERGLISTSVLRGREDLLQSVRGDVLNAKFEMAQSVAQDTDARTAVAEAELGFRREVRQELYEVAEDLQRVRARLSEMAARRDRLQVVSPVAGRIQLVVAKTPGEVIAPGERLFEIVPTSERLVAEIRLQPDDIGHVSAGDPVTLKPTAFDARRYGSLTGHIASISPTSLQDPEGRPYFSAEVVLDTTTLGRGPFAGEIGAGMVVMAEMQTGRRTVLQYLLKPIDQSLQMSMSER